MYLEQWAIDHHCQKDIMSLSSNDIEYTKLIVIDIETDPNLPPIATKPHTVPLKYQECARKELEDLGKVGIIQESLPPRLYLL